MGDIEDNTAGNIGMFKNNDANCLVYTGPDSFNCTISACTIKGQKFKSTSVYLNNGDIVEDRQTRVNDKGTLEVFLIIKRADGELERILVEPEN